ncbi:MAG: S-layer homology domain-containing protein [Evtepia sp.]|uniref:S-layer homology domain-containing protein n=1 Tax=Evtepia sp. TaxID=2773933 RepID=UPI002A7506E8|nr:S-layer homology domain-containing protein [Evtepia sp.]MDY3013990.1 S-layer homology domain-containing protein [Evtepia sp.]
MKKRWTALCLSLLLCLGLLPGWAQAAEGHFADVKDTDWHYLYVEKSRDLSLVQGSGGRFYPNDNLTQAEIVTIAVRVTFWIRGWDPPAPGSGRDWFAPYEEHALRLGILEDPLTTEEESWSVSRELCMQYLYRAVPASFLPEKNVVPDGSIPDVPMYESFAPAVYAFYRAGVLEGNDDKGSFLPWNLILRSEIAATLVRLMVPEARATTSLGGEVKLSPLDEIRGEAWFDGDLCSVAFLGCGDSIAEFINQIPVDAPVCETMPFLFSLPECQYLTQPGSEIYCVIPTWPEAQVRVRNYSMIGDDWGPREVLYSSERGHPLLLMGNVSDIIPNLWVEVTDPTTGLSVEFSPCLSLKDGGLEQYDGVRDISYLFQVN